MVFIQILQNFLSLKNTGQVRYKYSSTKVWLSYALFSSPEPKAQGELLWSLTVRRRRRPYVRPSVRPQSLNNISS